MKMWIARDKDGKLRLWKERPVKGLNGCFHNGALRGILWECLFPEVTFENSPQEVEIKLTNNGNQD